METKNDPTKKPYAVRTNADVEESGIISSSPTEEKKNQSFFHLNFKNFITSSSDSRDSSEGASCGTRKKPSLMDRLSPNSNSNTSSPKSDELSPKPDGATSDGSRSAEKLSPANSQKIEKTGKQRRQSFQSNQSKESLYSPDQRKKDQRRISLASEYLGKEVDFEKLRKVQDKDVESFENALINSEEWTWKPLYPKTVEEIVEELFAKTLEGDALSNLFFYQDKETSKFIRTLNIIQTVQNQLLGSILQHNGIKERQQILKKYLVSKQAYTHFTKTLCETFKKLSDLMEAKILFQKGTIDNATSSTNVLKNFIDYIKAGKYSCEEKGEGKINKKVHAIVLSFLGDNKKKQDNVLRIVNDWSNTDLMVKEYLNNMENNTYDYLANNISKVKHLWTEPLKHDLKGMPTPIDEISPKDVYENYSRLKCLVKIQNDPPFPGANFASSAECLLTLMSSLYDAYGFTIDDKKLKLEIYKLGQVTTWNEYIFSKESLECFRLLKMGCVNTAFRADYFLKRRLDLPQDFFTKIENTALEFFIDKQNPENTYVEQLRKYQIHSQDIGHTKCCVFPISWKVFYPLDDKWRCELQLKNVEMLENANMLQKHFINMRSDEVIKKMMGDEIKEKMTKEEPSNISDEVIEKQLEEIKIGHLI